MPEFYITTFTGIQFYLDNPRPEMVTIEDIAHHLALTCRWSGACRHHYSVAQHSVCVSKIVPSELRAWALLHDAAEAYIGDITRPLKAYLTHGLPDAQMHIRSIENYIMIAICEKFGLTWPEPHELKQYDDQMQKLEAQLFMPDGTRLHDRSCQGPIEVIGEVPGLPEIYLSPMLPEAAELMFLARFRKIFLDDDGL